ncbi:DUF4870 domain-containing protein [Myxococcota bacterium]|nr:DUF4870 domain-containing protein [Myxococcota bacterium]
MSDPTDAPSPAGLPSLPLAPPPAPSSPTAEERNLAVVAHALSFIEGGVIGPLIVYLVKKDDSPFVAFHALQSLYFGLLALVVIVPVAIITCGLGAVLLIPYFVWEVIACIEAHKGEWYELPFVGAVALRSHHP